ncbi:MULTISPECIES: hypothetical protein [Halobacillus]|uniref:hypothetical protein n=1 Tax=Halobacillus TaxID=45667 RepID=UPI0009A76EF9|nr:MULTISPECIES: hypothetical protein [Halobacillus]
MKIANFGEGNIKIAKDQAVVQLIENGEAEEINLDSLQHAHNQEPDTLHLQQATMEKGRVQLTYDIPDQFISLEQLKKETLPVRIAAIKSVLEIDPLSRKYTYSLHPSTVFFRPMTSVRFTYVDVINKGALGEHEAIDQYKALAYALISCQSYEAFLRHGMKAYKQKKLVFKKREQEQVIKLLKTIEESENLSELKADLQQSYEYTQYQYFQDIASIEKRLKNRFYAVVVCSLVALLLGVTGAYTLTNAQSKAIAQEYSEKLEQKELQIEKIQAVHDQDYKQVVDIMKRAGKSEKEIAAFLIKKEQYQLALDTNPTNKTVENVVSTMYEQEKKEKILDLKLEENQRLSDAKAVVAYNKSVLDSRKSFIEDATLAHRMGKAFIENGDLHSAEYLANQFDDKELTKLIEEKRQENERLKKIEGIEKQIDDLKKQIEDTDDEKEKEKLNEELKKAEKRLEELKK